MVKHVVILAGGAGTRLWPASRRELPKQFLDLGSGTSLFVAALRRAAALGIDGCLLVVTHADQAGLIGDQVALYRRSHGPFPVPVLVLAEPRARNTAPALAYAAVCLRGLDPQGGSFLVQTADHSIAPEASFAADVETASRLAEAGYLVTFGIPPTRPETGYGYIEAGAELSGKLAGGRGREVARFREKPDHATAEAYLARGGYFWNSGMFVFDRDAFLAALAASAPEVAGPFAGLAPAPKPPGGGEVAVLAPTPALRRVYDQLPSISIDYALMERHPRRAVVPASFDWSDVGSWDEVARLFPGGGPGTFQAAAGGNFVYSDLPVALAGIKDLIVVVKNGVVLVARRGDTQKVKELVEEVRRAGREELL